MKITYKCAGDGKEFDNEEDAYEHDRKLSRQKYYEMLLNKRNWFQRFLDIKPSMDFYDEMDFKTQLQISKR